jgi:hypothetical protein
VSGGGDTETVDPRHSFARACALGSGLAAIPFVWMCAIGRFTLLQSHILDGFYDAQAHSLLSGHWDVPREKLGFEAFVIGNKTYTYFGPWPSILRMPVAVFTHRFDGRLTQLSILLAFAVFMIATSRLLWRIRELARGDEPATRVERISVVVFMLVIGAGSVVLFLASRPVVYHEAELWGAAWSVAAFAAILELQQRPTLRAVVWSGVFTALALLTRGSVGLGPVVALGLVLAGHLLAILRGRRAAGDRNLAIAVLVALLVPLALYVYVNEARFGTPFKLPIDKQIATAIDPIRPHIFAGTHGSLFAAKFVPTDLVALLRPDAIGFSGVFPYITFPHRAHVLGNITFAAIDPATSLPVAMPFLFALGVAGVVAVFRKRFSQLRVLVIGGAIGGLGVVTIPFISQRYLSDFLPLVVVLAGAGMYLLLARGPRFRRALLVGFGVLAAASLLANFALALVYQRAYSPFTADSERAAFVRFQHDAPGASHMTVLRGARLPKPAAAGTLFVLGDCDGVYWSDGTAWHPVERTDAAGRYPMQLTLPPRPAGTRETILEAGAPGASDHVDVEYLAGDRIRFVFTSPHLPGEAAGASVPRPVGTAPVEIVYDTNLGQLDVSVRGRSVLGYAYGLAGAPVRIVAPGARLDAVAPNFCQSLTGG